MKGLVKKSVVIIAFVVIAISFLVLMSSVKADGPTCSTTYGSDFDVQTCSDGTSNLLVHEKRFLYNDVWTSVNTNIWQDTNFTGFNYSMLMAEYNVFFKNDSDTSRAVRFKKNNYTFDFDIATSQAQWYNSQNGAVGGGTQNPVHTIASVSGNTLTYPGAWGSAVNLSYILGWDNMKEKLVISSVPNNVSYADYFRYKINVYYNNTLQTCVYVNDNDTQTCYSHPSSVVVNTSKEIDFKDSNGTIVFFVPAPTLVDSAGNITTPRYFMSMNNGIDLWYLGIPAGFAKNATYPIILDPDLSISGTTQAMGGNLFYTNVLITNGGQLQVNGTGWINITAVNITIDSTSWINATKVGYSGGAGVGCSMSQASGNNGTGTGFGGWGKYQSGFNPSFGGGGAGYGGYGGASETNVNGHGANGTIYGSSSNLIVDMGSGGGSGNCQSGNGGQSSQSGGTGGGAVVLNATYINIFGNITANGVTPPDGSCPGSCGVGGAGGGSGGGILIYGMNINITGGGIYARGGNGGAGYFHGTNYGNYGGGGGGGGRIKIIYGVLQNTSSIIDVSAGSGGACIDSCSGNNGQTGVVGTLFYNNSIPYNSPPTISNVKKPTSPTNYNVTASYQFNATVCDPDNATDINTTLFNWDALAPSVVSTYAGINTTCREYYTTIGAQSVKTWNYNWAVNDSYNNVVVYTDNFTINKVPTVMSIFDNASSINNTGLIGFWRLESNSTSSVPDYSGNGRTGTTSVVGGQLCHNIVINNSQNSNSLQDYPLPINITNVTGMNANFNDLIFSNDSCGVTTAKSLPFWVQSNSSGNWVNVYVRIDNISASSVHNISVYYNYTSIGSLSNLTATCPGGYVDGSCLESLETFESAPNGWYNMTGGAAQLQSGFMGFCTAGSGCGSNSQVFQGSRSMDCGCPWWNSNNPIWGYKSFTLNSGIRVNYSLANGYYTDGRGTGPAMVVWGSDSSGATGNTLSSVTMSGTFGFTNYSGNYSNTLSGANYLTVRVVQGDLGWSVDYMKIYKITTIQPTYAISTTSQQVPIWGVVTFARHSTFNITNSVAGTYGFPLTVNTSTLTNFICGGESWTDNNNNPLTFFRATCNSTSALYYINLPSSGNLTFYLYYSNNSAVVDTSSAQAVSVNGIGDDFNDNSFNSSKWANSSTCGTITESNGYLNITCTATSNVYNFLYSVQSGLGDAVLESRMMITSLDNTGTGLNYHTIALSNATSYSNWWTTGAEVYVTDNSSSGPNFVDYDSRNGGSYTQNLNSSDYITSPNWVAYTIKHKQGVYNTYYENGVFRYNHTTNVYNTNSGVVFTAETGSQAPNQASWTAYDYILVRNISDGITYSVSGGETLMNSGGNVSQINGSVGYGLLLSNASISFSPISVGYNPFTISLWIKSTSGNWTSTNTSYLINQPYSFAISSESTGLKAYWWNTTHNFSGILTMPANNTNWHSLIISFNPSGTSLSNFIEYVDGTKYTITPSTITASSGSTTNLYIGDASNTYAGSYDEVMFWNRSLSDSEAQFLSRFIVNKTTNYSYSCLGNCYTNSGFYFGNTTSGTLTESLIGAGYDNRNLGQGNFYYLVNSTDNENYTANAFSVGLQESGQSLSPSNITLTGTTPITYGAGAGITAYDNTTGDADVNYTLWRNSTLVGSYNQTGTITDNTILGVGTYVYVFNNTQGANISAGSTSFTLTVNPATPSLSLGNNLGWSGQYPVSSTTTGSGCPAQITCNLYKNGAGVSNPDTGTFNVGSYIYIYNTSGNANYSSASTTNTLTISKGTPTLTLTINSSWSGTYPFSTNVTGDACPGELTCTLYRNGSSVSNPENIQLGAGAFVYVYNTSGNGNYNSASTTNTLTISKGNANVQISPTTQSITYGTGVTQYCSASSSTVSCKLYRNGTDITAQNNTVVVYGAGYYAFLANISDNANYTNWNATSTLNVSKATPSLTLTSNATWSVSYPTVTNITGDACPQGATCNLYRNGTGVSNPDIQTLAQGAYVYVYNTSASANYTNTSISNTLTVGGGTASCSLTSSNGWSYAYEPLTTLNCTCTGDGTQHLWIDGVQKDSLNNVATRFGAANHAIVCNITAGTNYGSATSSNSLNIAQKDAMVEGYPEDQSQNFGYIFLQYCTDNSMLYNCQEYLNGTLVTNNTNATLPAGMNYYVTNISDSSNYTNYEDDDDVNITANQTSINIFWSPDPPIDYGYALTNVSCYETNPEGHTPVALWRNGSIVSPTLLNHFNDSQTSENFTFTGNQNLTTWLTMPQNYVQSATVNLSGSAGITNPYLIIAGDVVWSYNGTFSQTNNITLDFSQQLINHLATCYPTANCSVQNTDIPLLFHSDTSGTILVTAINVIYGTPSELTYLPAGVWNYTCWVNATQNFTSAQTTRIYTVNKANVMTTLYLNGSVTDMLSTYPNSVINATATSDTSGLYVQLWRNGTLIANTTTVSNDITQVGAGYWNYTAYTIGNANYSGAGSTHFWTVSKNSTALSLSIDGYETDRSYIYPRLTNTTGFSCPTFGASDVTCNLYRNGTLKSNPEIITLPSGAYGYIYNTSGGQNYTSSSVGRLLTIGQNSSTCSLTFDNPSPINYETLSTASCSCTNVETSANLYRDGSLANSENGVAIRLSADTHNYTCNVSSTQNYTSGSNSSSYVVNKKDATVTVYPQFQSESYPYTFTQYCTDNSALFDCSLYRNGTLITNNTVYTPIVGVWEYKANISDNANYTNYQDIEDVSVLPSNTTVTNIFWSPNPPITYGVPTFVNCTTNNPESNDVTLYRNGTNVTAIENNVYTTLPAGVWNYTCIIPNSTNYLAANSTRFYFVNQYTQNLIITANASFTGSYPYPIIVTGSGNNLTATLYRNGTIVSNPYVDLLKAGVYDFIFNASGNANFTAGQTEQFLAINKGTIVVNLYLNGTKNANVSYLQNTIVNATGTASAGTVNLYRDGVAVSNPDNFTEDTSLHSYKVNATGNENYTDDAGFTYYVLPGTTTPPTISSISYSSTCIQATTPTTFSWTQNEGNHGPISQSYAVFDFIPQPHDTIPSTSTNDGIVSVTYTPTYAGAWTVSAFVISTDGTTASTSNTLTVNPFGYCPGSNIGGGGTIGETPQPQPQVNQTNVTVKAPISVQFDFNSIPNTTKVIVMVVGVGGVALYVFRGRKLVGGKKDKYEYSE